MTALVMLMLVTRAMAQPPDHHTHREVLLASTFTSTPPEVLSRVVKGCDVWEDGMVWAVIEEEVVGTGPGGSVVRSRLIVWDPDNNETPEWMLIGGHGFAPVSVWPHSLVCGEPDSSRPNIGAGYARLESYGYSVGGWLALVPAVIVISDPGGPVDDKDIPPEATYRVNAWIHRASWVYGEIPGYCGTGNAFCQDLAAMRTFVGANIEIMQEPVEGYVELFDADTLPEVDQTITDAITSKGPNLKDTDLVVGGAYRGRAWLFGEHTLPPAPNQNAWIWRDTETNSTDALVVLLRYQGLQSGLVIPDNVNPGQNDPSQPVLTFGSSGDDAVLAVAFNHNTGQVAVAGYYGAADIDFDPDPESTIGPYNNNYAGGKDLFVAVYTYARDPGAQNQYRWRLDWRYTYGTEEDDAAEGVVFDVTGRVYAAGWLSKDGGGTNAWSAGFDEPPNPSPNDPTDPYIMWIISHEGIEDDSAWKRVNVDGIGRPVLVGRFTDSVTLNPGFEPPQNVITLTAQGGEDGLVACFHPDDGSVEWAFRLGGDEDDSCEAVAVCQYNSARLVVGGSFEDWVQFDPREQAQPVQAVGLDGFVNLFDPDPDPEQATDDLFHISLLMPNVYEFSPNRFSTTPCDPSAIGGDPGSWRVITSQIAAPLGDDSIVPQDGSVSLQASLYSATMFNLREGREQALQVVPSTRITERTAPLFARRLASIIWYHRKDATYRRMGEGLSMVGDWAGWDQNPLPFAHPHLAEDGIRHVLFIESRVNEWPFGSSVGFVAGELIQEQYGRPIFDAINGIGVANTSSGYTPATRNPLGETIANSHIKFPDGWSTAGVPEWERNLAIIAQVDGWDSQCFGTGQTRAIEDILPLVLMRLTRLFGDYDGDGVVDVSFSCQNPGEPSGDDWDAFLADTLAEVPFANWNFDYNLMTGVPIWDGHRRPPTFNAEVFGIDFSKFITGAIGGCQ